MSAVTQNERIFIVVDGNNFYHRLKDLGLKNLLQLDYGRFVAGLTGSRRAVLKKYYIGAVREERRNPKSRELRQGQRKLLERLYGEGWQVGFGHMLKTDGYHEKGVDVLMAVDLLVGAYENLYDTAILVSSDTDLIPALAKVRAMRKRVEYIGFSPKPSYGLITHSDGQRIFAKEDLTQFLP